jgi:argininosuccinate lyase
MPLWGSRFKKPLADIALRFSSSIDLDKRLFKEDILGSLAHVEMLVAKHILKRNEGTRISKALKEIQKEIERGKLDLSWRKEDIHLAIESRLIEENCTLPVAGTIKSLSTKDCTCDRRLTPSLRPSGISKERW